MTQREKMPKTARRRYCASYTDQWCVRRECRVCEGSKDVCSDVIEAVGDTLLRNLERVDLSFRRNR